MTGNNCIYTDTDSVVLESQLPDHIIGKELGQMKLESKIQHGIFIRKKLYAYLNDKGILVRKSSGVDPKKLNWSHYYDLLKGKTVKIINRITFQVNWKALEINLIEKEINLKGLDKTNVQEEQGVSICKYDSKNKFAIVPLDYYFLLKLKIKYLFEYNGNISSEILEYKNMHTAWSRLLKRVQEDFGNYGKSKEVRSAKGENGLAQKNQGNKKNTNFYTSISFLSHACCAKNG